MDYFFIQYICLLLSVYTPLTSLWCFSDTFLLNEWAFSSLVELPGQGWLKYTDLMCPSPRLKVVRSQTTLLHDRSLDMSGNRNGSFHLWIHHWTLMTDSFHGALVHRNGSFHLWIHHWTLMTDSFHGALVHRNGSFHLWIHHWTLRTDPFHGALRPQKP